MGREWCERKHILKINWNGNYWNIGKEKGGENMGVSSNSCLNVWLVGGANRSLGRKLAKHNMSWVFKWLSSPGKEARYVSLQEKWKAEGWAVIQW